MANFRGSSDVVRNPFIRFLDDEQCRKVHNATLELLEKTGVWIDDPECLEMLRGAGARVVDNPPKNGSKYNRRVQMPAQLVEDAIRSAPESVTVYNRQGDVAMELGERNCYFGFFGDIPDYHDPYTNERRKTVFADIEKQNILNDYLPNADWVLSVGNCHDVDLKYTYQGSAEAILRNTTKPVIFCSGDVEVVTDIMDMAAAIVGSHEKVRSKPYIVCLDEPVSPLLHDPDSIKRVFKCAELGLPVIDVPMPMVGVSTPCSLIGAVLMGNAESLSGLVFHQLKRKGAPYVYGALPSTMDMRLGSFNYGAPELSMMCSDMAHYYKLPVWGTGGCCDSNVMDAQAGAEATFSLLASVLSGANLVHDIAIYSQGLCISPGFSLILDEIVSMVKRFAEGFEVSDEALNLDLIDEIGPGGTFITHRHTYHHFQEMWSPRIFDRTSFKRLDKDHISDVGERAQKRAGEIIKEHKPELLTESALMNLDEVTKKWHRE
jgi:trimethylamine--corrinoid protein Co-methyltransferase